MNDRFSVSLNNLLADGRLSHVVDVLSRKCAVGASTHPDLNQLIPSLQRIADTYVHMRQFLLDGVPDPERDKIYNTLKNHLREIARDYLFIINEDRLDPFFADYRLQKARNRSMAELADELQKTDYRLQMAAVTEADPVPFLRKKEDIVRNIFLKTWSLPPWAEEDRKTIGRMLLETDAEDRSSFSLRSQLISALMLGLLKFYDPGKFLLLLEAYDNFSDERLAARALTAIVLVLQRHGNSVLYDSRVHEVLNTLADSIMTYTRLREVVMTLIKTRDTDRVSREVADAFKTTMKNISPDVIEKMSREGMTIDSSETGMNPEWEKLMKNKELEEKMQRINDMQLEGMDVMMQSFGRLKTFPFFQSLPNWFLTFSPAHSAVNDFFEIFDEEAFTAMAEATDMCASDQYSFALGILQMPEDRRKALGVSVRAQLEGMREILKDRENVRKKPVFATEVLIFSRDLYRFAKLFPKKREFFDPFDNPLNFLSLPVLGSLLSEDEIKLAVADFYFEHGYHTLALPLFENIVATGNAEKTIFEKIGYCYQMAGDFQHALENYEKADLFSSDADKSSTWLLKKLAFCNKALGYYDKAAEFYRKVIERHPDDVNLEFHLGSVLLRAGDIKGAKELLSKVHYLNPDHDLCTRTYTRLKGHDAFLEGRYKDAVKLYEEARGDQQPAQYSLDLQVELGLLSPEFDMTTFQILMDGEQNLEWGR